MKYIFTLIVGCLAITACRKDYPKQLYLVEVSLSELYDQDEYPLNPYLLDTLNIAIEIYELGEVIGQSESIEYTGQNVCRFQNNILPLKIHRKQYKHTFSIHVIDLATGQQLSTTEELSFVPDNILGSLGGLKLSPPDTLGPSLWIVLQEDL